MIGFLLPLPGFAASFGYDIGRAASDMYALGWVFSLLMGGLAYWVVSRGWRLPGDDQKYHWEELVGKARDVV